MMGSFALMDNFTLMGCFVFEARAQKKRNCLWQLRSFFLIYDNVNVLNLLLDVTVTLLEAIYATCGINELALTSIEWV